MCFSVISATLDTFAPGFTCKYNCTNPSLSVLNFIGPLVLELETVVVGVRIFDFFDFLLLDINDLKFTLDMNIIIEWTKGVS